MGASFSPAIQDVERYRDLRPHIVELNHKIVETIPSQAYADIGDALGIRRGGVLMFDTEDMASVLMDACLHEWYEDGKNLVQRYADRRPASPGTDESYLLQTCLDAKYRVLALDSAVPGAGLRCRDLLHGGEELFLMDVALSRNFVGGMALATRTMPLGEFWITGGAGLPCGYEADVPEILHALERELGQPLESAPNVSLSIIRLCLDAGAAEHVAYADPRARRRRRTPRVHFKRRKPR